MNFTITEAEVIRLTGYSRPQLLRLRQGFTQEQGGKEYVAEPVLMQGKDWQRYGRAVLYASGAVNKLQIRKNLNGGV